MRRPIVRRPLTAEILKELLVYDPQTGIFSNRVKRGNRGIAGAATGAMRKRGYTLIGIEGREYYAHRLAWLYINGAWPSGDIDHIDGDPANNRIANLRDVSTTVNCQNHRRAKRDSSTGVIGVTPHRDKFIAWICVDKKRLYLGVYETTEEASAVYLEHKRRLHPGCTI